MNLLTRISQNWKSGLTVSLVSIPLSVSLALAGGSTPVAGIITAIWAGLFASLFGGSHFNIVGPTGALSGLLALYAFQHGTGALAMLAIVSGLVVLIAWMLKLERYLVLIPSSTVQGFTLGVAFIIGLNQLNSALGIRGLSAHQAFIENVWETLTHLSMASWMAVVVFLCFLGGLFVLVKLTPKFPGAIILTPFGILLGAASVNGWLPLKLITLGQLYPNLRPVLFNAPQFFIDVPLITASLTVALIAILETMLSAKIADNMTNTKHHKRKELFGLGVANIAAGLAGGIPATAALARTSLNIKSGANHKTSAVISSISIAIISLVFLTWFRYIPMPVIAAILVFVAIRMIEVKEFKRMWAVDKTSFWLAVLVAAITIVEDPIVGIVVGAAISLLVFSEKLSHGTYELVINDESKRITKRIASDKNETVDEQADTIVYSIKGELAYLNSAAHIERLELQSQTSKHVVIRLRELGYIDYEGVEAFDAMIERLTGAGKRVFISGINHNVESMLAKSHSYHQLKSSGHIFSRTTDALTSLGYKL